MVSILDQVVEELEQKNAQQNQVVEEEEEGEEEGVVWYIECGVQLLSVNYWHR